MNKPVYAIYDAKSTFLDPVVDSGDASARRAFAFAINNGGLMGFAPGDFQLYHIADYDTCTGSLTALSPFELICNGLEVYNEKS